MDSEDSIRRTRMPKSSTGRHPMQLVGVYTFEDSRELQARIRNLLARLLLTTEIKPPRSLNRISPVSVVQMMNEAKSWQSSDRTSLIIIIGLRYVQRSADGVLCLALGVVFNAPPQRLPWAGGWSSHSSCNRVRYGWKGTPPIIVWIE